MLTAEPEGNLKQADLICFHRPNMVKLVTTGLRFACHCFMKAISSICVLMMFFACALICGSLPYLSSTSAWSTAHRKSLYIYLTCQILFESEAEISGLA